MSDELPLYRQWRMLRMLAARKYGMSVQEMSDEFGVSTETIRRDIRMFQSVGFPLQEKTVENGRKLWCISSDLTKLAFR